MLGQIFPSHEALKAFALAFPLPRLDPEIMTMADFAKQE